MTPDGGDRPITPQRWERIDDALHGALQRAPYERDAYLDRVCVGDDALRREVESLLAEHERSGFLDRPNGSVLAPLLARLDAAAPKGAGHAGARTVSHYEVLGRVAGGGMGVLYEARDTRLGRAVALKFLHPHLSGDPAAKARFLLEARAAAALDHPNVCTVHAIGETDDGELFIAMPLYDGETLRSRIARGPLAVDEALAIALQAARGLGAAHAHGIVHRDVKPANLLVTRDGVVKVLDFGIAKLADAAHTASGATPGTAAYVSPEQVRSEPVDLRTDVWSLGVVLYEMLAGRRPFEGEPIPALLHAICTAEPAPVTALRPEVPHGVEGVVRTALAKQRDARHPSMRALEDDLRTLGTGGARAAARPGSVAPAQVPSPTAGGMAARPWRRRGLALSAFALLALLAIVASRGTDARRATTRAIAPAPIARERIIVADFANRTSDTTYGDLVAHVLRSELARSSVLTVVGRQTISSTMRLMRRAPDTRLDGDLAREVAVRGGVRAVIAGDVRTTGSGLLLSASVVEASSGDVIHGATETARDSTEVLAAIGRLSARIREGVGESLASIAAGDRLLHFTTASLPALRKHMAGYQALWRGDYPQSAALMREAIALDPEYADAHLGLWGALANAGLPTSRVVRPLARAYELRARLTDRERFAIEGIYHLHVTGDLARSVSAFRRHIDAIGRGEGGWYASFSDVLETTGDLAEAEVLLEEARQRFPTAANQAALVRVLHAQGKDVHARAILDDVSRRYPEHPIMLRTRVNLLAVAGRYDEAYALAGRMPRQLGVVGGLAPRAEIDAVRGRYRAAIGHLRALGEVALTRGDLPSAVEIAAAAGRLRMLAGDRAGAAEVDDLLARHRLDTLDVLARPYLPLALFDAEVGRPRRARAWLDRYEREIPREFRGADRWLLHRARAGVYRAEGNPMRALAELRQALRLPATRVAMFDDKVTRLSSHPELARVYDELGSRDSAIAVHERYVAARSLGRTVTDAFALGPTLERLGALYAERGDWARAAAHYRRFAELWAGADPALQPRVEAARRRAAALASPPD